MIDVYAWGTTNGLRATLAMAECGLAHQVIPKDQSVREGRWPRGEERLAMLQQRQQKFLRRIGARDPHQCKIHLQWKRRTRLRIVGRGFRQSQRFLQALEFGGQGVHGSLVAGGFAAFEQNPDGRGPAQQALGLWREASSA